MYGRNERKVVVVEISAGVSANIEDGCTVREAIEAIAVGCVHRETLRVG